MSAFGEEEGQVCWRDGCQGVIAVAKVEGCSCHISPPCNACTTPREYCPVCDWRAKDEDYRDYAITCDLSTGMFHAPLKERPLDPRKISYHSRGHTASTMIKEGIYPDGTSQADVLAKVKGTFGGRFEHFGGGKFKYIAYTD